MVNADSVDVIFFAAHADDIELTCGGTVARMVKAGHRAGIVDLTGAEMSSHGTPATRRRESRAAARILGATFREQLDFGDGGLRTGRKEELQIIDIVRRWRPRLVFAPWPDERHPDHARAGRLITEASFYAGLRRLETTLPAHRPQAVVYYLQNYLPPLSFVVDVSATWKTKMRAVNAYKSQFGAKSKRLLTFISDPRFMEMIEARGHHFGALIGSHYGEAFVTRQPPRIEDVFEAYAGREV